MESGERLKLFRGKDSFTAHIIIRKYTRHFIILTIWLAAWTFGGLALPLLLLTDKGAGPGMAFVFQWYVGWAIGEFIGLLAWLWNAFGKEVISVSEGMFTYKRDLFGRGRINTFPLKDLSNLRILDTSAGNSSGNNGLKNSPYNGGLIGVDRDGTLFRFGINLELEEARRLIKDLAPYFQPFAHNTSSDLASDHLNPVRIEDT